MERCPDDFECAADLERILEWACLTACLVRQNAAGIEKYRRILEAKGETDWRLQELNGWGESTAFTEREKAALSLSETMSSRLAIGTLLIAVYQRRLRERFDRHCRRYAHAHRWYVSDLNEAQVFVEFDRFAGRHGEMGVHQIVFRLSHHTLFR